MLKNPFTPSEIASEPTDFFGRKEEIRIFERAIEQGSVSIQGSIGIGKSSLLSRILLFMEGFSSRHNSISFIAVGNKNVESVDDAAKLLLESFVSIDEKKNKISFKLPKVASFESEETVSYYKEGKYLSVLKNIIQEEYLKLLINDGEFILIAIDEADKCPIPLAQVIRNVATHTQQLGIKKIRFIVAGVSPFFSVMIKEDSGINRFFYKNIILQPLSPSESNDLLDTKFNIVIKEARNIKLDIRIEDTLYIRIVELSGGHPHLLQLLGSHIVENENETPDEIIDHRDLAHALQKICYDDRGFVYEATIHLMDVYGHLENFKKFIYDLPLGFPTKIRKHILLRYFTEDNIHWMVENNIISQPLSGNYGLVDEFLRIRFIFDNINEIEQINQTASRIVYPEDEIDLYESESDDMDDDLDEAN